MGEAAKPYIGSGDPAARIGLDEALARLTPTISDQEAATEEKRVDEVMGALGLPGTSIPEALLPWTRRERAMHKLDAALSNDELRPQLHNNPEDGSPPTYVNLVSAQWRASAFREQIILGGAWRDSVGGLPQYNGWLVTLAEAAFCAWLDRSTASDSIPATTAPISPQAKWDSGAEWITAVVSQEKDALSNMPGIAAAAKALADRSQTDLACPYPLKPKYVENKLRPHKLFPKAKRGQKP